MEGMSLEGDVETVPVPDLLGWLARRRASGILSLSRGMVVRRFHLRAGRVVLASSSEEQTLLGRLLLERGLIAEPALRDALAARGRAPTRLGKALERAGLVSRAELSGVLAEKVWRLLEDAMAWPDGRFFFDDASLPRKRAAIATPIDLDELLGRAPPPSPAPRARGHVVRDADVLEVQELGNGPPA